MKVLFLDIDGVLNCGATFEGKHRCDVIDRDMVQEINRVIQATDCNVVISSSWRLAWPMGELKARLRQEGMIDRVIDKTPMLRRRDDEILAWLKEHPEVTRFAVVDDDSFDLTAVADRLAHTSFETGLLAKHADRLIELLND